MTLVAELIVNVDAAVQSYARAAFAAVAAAAGPLVRRCSRKRRRRRF